MEILIIGAGAIGIEYSKILDSMNLGHVVVGRGENSATQFKEKTGKEVFVGGLSKYLEINPIGPSKAIVAVGTLELAATTIELIKHRVKDILVEKPGANDPKEIDKVAEFANKYSANVYLAYNRRFHASTLKAEEIINADRGLTSINFEFTEWSHIIEKLDKPIDVLNNWFFANSTHVVDLAFFLAGHPRELSAFTAGEMNWHKPSIFAGAGVTERDVLFTYQANWQAPGRWSVELLTRKHRLYLKPMETLQIQELGSVAVNPVEIDDKLDKEFKPGFYLETKAFIEGDCKRLCSIQDQQYLVRKAYSKMLQK